DRGLRVWEDDDKRRLNVKVGCDALLHFDDSAIVIELNLSDGLADELFHLLAQLWRALVEIFRIEQERLAARTLLFVAHRHERERQHGDALVIDFRYGPLVDELEIGIRFVGPLLKRLDHGRDVLDLVGVTLPFLPFELPRELSEARRRGN